MLWMVTEVTFNVANKYWKSSRIEMKISLTQFDNIYKQ